jgi:hypothetical protein
MPPSCVNTTHPIVENKKINVAANSARTACLKEVLATSSFHGGNVVILACGRESVSGFNGCG